MLSLDFALSPCSIDNMTNSTTCRIPTAGTAAQSASRPSQKRNSNTSCVFLHCFCTVFAYRWSIDRAGLVKRAPQVFVSPSPRKVAVATIHS